MVSISSSVQAGEASQEKPMQEIAPESMSATEKQDVNLNIDCGTYARVAVGCGEVGVELWVVPVGDPRHDDGVQVPHHLGPVLRLLGGGVGHQLGQVAGAHLVIIVT